MSKLAIFKKAVSIAVGFGASAIVNQIIANKYPGSPFVYGEPAPPPPAPIATVTTETKVSTS
jgi:hypothetical protein